MVYPSGAVTHDAVSKYQGVVIAEVACTLILFITLRILHFCFWGYTQVNAENTQNKKEAESDSDGRRWDQQGWDVYFPIIFANHIIAIGLPILYTASIFVCVLAFIHFALFVAMLIVNIFIKDAEPGQGSRTTVTRIVWGLMCLVNVILFITGLAGIRQVIQ